MKSVHLCAGVLERNGAVLLVASRYPNHADLLWNLPGGRRRDGELLPDALTREWREEVGLEIVTARLLYISESYDRREAVHFLSAIFAIAAEGEPTISGSDAHVADVAWVARERLAERLVVPVVREPLLAHLAGDPRRYFGFDDAGITIEFADEA